MQLNPEQKLKCMKYSTIIGATLLLMPNGMFWYWGNLSVYSHSYFVSILNSMEGLESSWVLSLFIVFWTLTITASRHLSNCIGRRCTALVGAIVTDIGIFSSYFALQYSFPALVVTMGAVVGTGTGLIDSSGLQVVIEWADDDTGKLTSGLQGAMALGGFVINQFITLYINPNNLNPDLKLGETKYFTQVEILKRVPYVYVILGSFSAGTHLLGFCILRQKPKDENYTVDLLSLSSTGGKVMWKSDKTNTQNAVSDAPTENSRIVGKPSSDDSSKIADGLDYSPREMIKTVSFYAIWITFFMGTLSFTLIVNYYKAFGQLWVSDDHFLTDVGTAIVLLNAIVSLFSGIAMDKFGVKNCIIFDLALLAMVEVWYYCSAVVSRWLFLLATLLMGCVASTIFSCYTAATVLLYGKTHFTSNLGIVLTSSLSFSLIAPFFVQRILTSVGWFPTFVFAVCFSAVRLLIVIFFIPQL